MSRADESSITTPLRVHVPGSGSVSALSTAPAAPWAGHVLAHGAGAGMAHAFMEAFAQGLAERGVATLRFQFPFMESGSKRTDSPAVAQAAVRAAVVQAGVLWPGLPLFAGGKSFGGRMTSQAQAAQPLAGVRGLVFVGFPLHPAGKPSIERGSHLGQVNAPMLFLQGTRDALAELRLLEQALVPLKDRATLKLFEDADHAFHVRVRSGRTDEQTLGEMLDATVAWIRLHLD
jgi:predicted alpha/beta-hydrolase family hydrolase